MASTATKSRTTMHTQSDTQYNVDDNEVEGPVIFQFWQECCSNILTRVSLTEPTISSGKKGSTSSTRLENDL